jgi:hypothetical protein
VEEDRIFIIDGPIWTSAGMTAGIDLALAMVEKDLGTEVARSVAKKLVVYHRHGHTAAAAIDRLDWRPVQHRRVSTKDGKTSYHPLQTVEVHQRRILPYKVNLDSFQKKRLLNRPFSR